MKKHSSKWLLLSLLESAGSRGITTAEILQAGVGSRYGGRLLELRKDGYTVESVREKQSGWRYTLLNSPDYADESILTPEVIQEAHVASEQLLASRPDVERGGREPGFAKPSPSTPSLSTDQGSLFEHAKGELGFHNQEAA